MIQPRLFICNGATAASNLEHQGRKIIELSTSDVDANVNIRIENITQKLQQNISDRLIDLIEIAAFVYAADRSTSRGTAWTEGKESWGRDFHFVIAVRDLDFWLDDEIKKLLSQILNFLADDKYGFEFCELQKDCPKQLYLELNDQKDNAFKDIEKVSMFSGGLDSLAGAVKIAASGKNLVLVSHIPVATMDKRLSNLFCELQKTYPSVQMTHIPVWVNKSSNLTREYTQRTRSFLFSALGAAVAKSIGVNGINFFENGVVSLNLPVADEVVRARATRTTHPFVLSLFEKLLSLVTENEFKVDNPFIFRTKTEIISLIAQNGGSKLLPLTCSCAHQQFKSKTQWHCGTCSQCIDRRIAMLAAQQEEYDPEIDYVSDVFTGKRKDGYETNMAVNYARHSLELNRMDELEMASKFNRDIFRAVRSFPRQREAGEKILAMHKRHGESVTKVLNQQVQKHSNLLLQGELVSSSMIAMIAGQKHLTSSWRLYSEKIIELLQLGVPTACQKHKPKDEPHLQEICDGILKGHDPDIIREFPFMRWSSSATKPDWSVESLLLWIELKYVRKKADIRPITKDIAEDITKYGDNERRVLYVIYDPEHLVTNEDQFSQPILSRESMMIHFIR